MRSGYRHTPHARARLRVRRTCRARAHAHTLACTLALCSRPTPRNCHRAEHDAAMTDPRNAVSRAIAAPPSPTRDPIVRPHRLHTDCATGRARARVGRRQQCSHTSTATGSSSAIDGGRRATGAAESHGSKVSPPRPRPSLPLSLPAPPPPSPSSSLLPPLSLIVPSLITDGTAVNSRRNPKKGQGSRRLKPHARPLALDCCVLTN